MCQRASDQPWLEEPHSKDGEDKQGAEKRKQLLLLEESDVFSSKSFFPC